MAEFKKKSKSSFWTSPLVMVVLLILVVFLVYSVIGLIQKEKETSRKKELVLDKIDSLHSREGSLSKDIAKLETEDGIEDVIREKYQVVKKGEKMVVIIDEAKISQEDNKLTDHSFLGWVKNIFHRK